MSSSRQSPRRSDLRSGGGQEGDHGDADRRLDLPRRDPDRAGPQLAQPPARRADHPPTNDPACRSSLAMRMARLVAALGAVTCARSTRRARLGWSGGDRRPEARPGRELHLAGLRRRPDGRSSAHLRRRAAGPDPRRPWRVPRAPFLDIRNLVSFGGERGLLSIAFPPDYASSGRFYVYYTARSPDGAMTIAEFRRASADRAAPASRRIVLDTASTWEPQWRPAAVRARRASLDRHR